METPVLGLHLGFEKNPEHRGLSTEHRPITKTSNYLILAAVDPLQAVEGRRELKITRSKILDSLLGSIKWHSCRDRFIGHHP